MKRRIEKDLNTNIIYFFDEEIKIIKDYDKINFDRDIFILFEILKEELKSYPYSLYIYECYWSIQGDYKEEFLNKITGLFINKLKESL